jgi:hypothetical protein
MQNVLIRRLGKTAKRLWNGPEIPAGGHGDERHSSVGMRSDGPKRRRRTDVAPREASDLHPSSEPKAWSSCAFRLIISTLPLPSSPTFTHKCSFFKAVCFLLSCHLQEHAAQIKLSEDSTDSCRWLSSPLV